MPRRPALAKLKGIWRDQVFADHALTPATFKLAYNMADMITWDDSAALYQKTGRVKIWPPQKLLQKRTELSPDTIVKALAALIQGGHLKRTKHGNQHIGPNKYRLLFKKEPT